MSHVIVLGWHKKGHEEEEIKEAETKQWSQ
jgi:hypothetical protein